MSGHILQINFNFKVPAEAYINEVKKLAGDIAAVPGMEWKVWLMNEADSEAGGIYWFSDSASLQAYLQGPIVAGIQNHPALENISAKVFDSIPELTAITRGPTGARDAA